MSTNPQHSPRAWNLSTQTLIQQNRKSHLNKQPLSASSATILSRQFSALFHQQAKFMLARMDIMVPQCLSVMENECFARPCMAFRSSKTLMEWTDKQHLVVHIAMFATKYARCQIKSPQPSRRGWRTAFALDTGELPDNDDQDSFNNVGVGLGGTRLGRIVSAAGRQLLEKLNSARKNFPMKVFLLLLGFYTANALATILGQTGDWDVVG